MYVISSWITVKVSLIKLLKNINLGGTRGMVGQTAGRLPCSYDLLDSHANSSSGFTEVRVRAELGLD